MQTHAPGGQVYDVKLPSISLGGQMWAKPELIEITAWCCLVWITLTLGCQFLSADLCEDFKEQCHTQNSCCSGNHPNVLFQGPDILLRVSRWCGRKLPWQIQKQNPTDFSEAKIWSMSYKYLFWFWYPIAISNAICDPSKALNFLI